MPKSKLLAYVALLLPLILINASTVAAYLHKHDAQSISSEVPRLNQRAPSCPGFDGNSGFYGLGIRLGVYLQWIASWLTNTLSPSEAGRSHDANSIFVLAIVVAIVTSIASGNIKPVEVYVMLLICFGFFFTVLSFLGIRLYFLTAASIAKMFKRAWTSLNSWYASRKGRGKRVFHSMKAALADTGSTGARGLLEVTLSALKMLTLDMSFTSASSVKHHSLSWSGVLWRTAIASMVASVNIYLWWSPWRLHRNATDVTQCDTLVYFFGRQELSPTMVTFFKTASIILAVPIFYLFLVLFVVLRAMLRLTRDVVLHRLFGSTFGDTRLFASWNKLPEPVKKYFFSGSFFPTTPFGFSPLLDILEVYLNSSAVEQAGAPLNQELPEEHENPPSLNDLVKAYIGFLSRGTEATEDIAPHDTQTGSASLLPVTSDKMLMCLQLYRAGCVLCISRSASCYDGLFHCLYRTHPHREQHIRCLHSTDDRPTHFVHHWHHFSGGCNT